MLHDAASATPPASASPTGSTPSPPTPSTCPSTTSRFDLVFGHAVLHHLPDLDQAFREFRRVLRPGGVVFFAGEPSRARRPHRGLPEARGDRAPRRCGAALVRAAPAAEHRHVHGHGERPNGHDLEAFVDVHAFDPGVAEGASPTAPASSDVRVRGEELLANWFGWTNRTLEASAEPGDRSRWLWRQYAYRGYLALQAVDRALLEGRLPPAIFYNLIITAREALQRPWCRPSPSGRPWTA